MSTQHRAPPAVDRLVNFAEPDVGPEEEVAVLRVLRSGWITTGEENTSFESELAGYLQCPYVATLSSCTAALEAALAYLRLPAGSTVAVPTWTFAATGLAAAHLGLRPALVDVDPATLNISPDSLRQLVGSGDRPAAAVPVHFAGVPVDDAVYELCHAEGIPVVGDAAHALGARDRLGPIAGRRAVADCFSFYATKNLTCAEGGAIATFDRDLFEFVTAYRLHGLDRDAWRRHRVESTVDYDLRFPGIKGNLPDLLAAVGRAQLRRFDAMQRHRAAVVDAYLSALAGVAGASALPSMRAAGSAYHLFAVVLEPGVDRTRVRKRLAELRVGSSVHFTPLHRYEWFAEHAVVSPSGLAVADGLAERVLSLPLHTRMTEADVAHVCAALRTALAEQGC